jgi:hypothetical protein
MNTKEYRASLLEAYVIKSNVKQQVFNNTAESFLILKKGSDTTGEGLHQMYFVVRFPIKICLITRSGVHLKWISRSVATSLFFSMHSNVFEFDNKHPVNKIPYVLDDP